MAGNGFAHLPIKLIRSGIPVVSEAFDSNSSRKAPPLNRWKMAPVLKEIMGSCGRASGYQGSINIARGQMREKFKEHGGRKYVPLVFSPTERGE